jgi:hypothetical protein
MFSTVDDPRDAAIVDAVVERIAEIFGPRHDDLMQRHDALVRRLDEVETQLVDLGRLSVEIQRGATYTQMLAQNTWAQSAQGTPTPPPPPPRPHAPRPKAIDDACAVAPGESAKVVRLPRYGVVVAPEPGADPDVVWPGVAKSLNTEGSARGLPRSRRTRRG